MQRFLMRFMLKLQFVCVKSLLHEKHGVGFIAVFFCFRGGGFSQEHSSGAFEELRKV
jgi:hypothetical protein